MIGRKHPTVTLRAAEVRVLLPATSLHDGGAHAALAALSGVSVPGAMVLGVRLVDHPAHPRVVVSVAHVDNAAHARLRGALEASARGALSAGAALREWLDVR